MNKRFLLALAGAVFFGLVSIYAAKFYLEQRVTQAKLQQETGVVIASTDIPLGTKIEAQHITVVRYPKELLPDQAMVQENEVIGRVSIADIPARTPVLGRQLSGLGAQPGLSGITRGEQRCRVRFAGNLCRCDRDHAAAARWSAAGIEGYFAEGAGPCRWSADEE